jgi:hypothetical protein
VAHFVPRGRREGQDLRRRNANTQSEKICDGDITLQDTNTPRYHAQTRHTTISIYKYQSYRHTYTTHTYTYRFKSSYHILSYRHSDIQGS